MPDAPSDEDTPKKPYRPMALIFCLRCGKTRTGPSGAKICDCPEEEPVGFIESVHVAGRPQELPDDVA
jgi:hypothetical protein